MLHHSPRCNDEEAGNISLLHRDLLSTIFSFCDLRTCTCLLRLVCKAWRDACNSPVAFAGQRLVLREPATAMHWARCFPLVKCLDMQCNDQHQFDTMIDALAAHVSSVQRLKVAIYKPVYQVQISLSLSRLSAAFRKLVSITIDVSTVLTVPFRKDNNDLSNFLSDDTELLLPFSQHFPHITTIHFTNSRFSVRDVVLPAQPALIRCLSSLPSITSLRCHSLTLTLVDDTILHTIAHSCPQLQEFRLEPSSLYGTIMTANGLRALGAGCPRLSSFGLHNSWSMSEASIAMLLSECRNIHTLDLRSTVVRQRDLATVLSSYPRITRLIIDADFLYWSPHIRDLTVCVAGQFAPLSAIDVCLARSPQVRNVVLRVTKSEISISQVDMRHLRSKYPTVERLVWQRDWLTASDPCKSEEVYRAETGDPKTYRVIF